MKKYKTIYGTLNGVSEETYYKDGTIKECIIEKYSLLKTKHGDLIPKSDFSDVRSKYRNSLSFYSSGKLKSVYLEKKSPINSEIGTIHAEMVTFYENGNVHRVFPLYGQISGYWTEEEELKSLEPLKMEINNIPFHNKISCYCLYPSGRVKSLTLGPKEKIKIKTSMGEIETRIGISFYESGKIESIEPDLQTPLKSPIGDIIAYDNNPIGIHGDNNSLKFTDKGVLLSVKTIQSGVEIVDNNNEKKEILPKRRRSFVDMDNYEMVPIEIVFRNEKIEIQDSDGWLFEYSTEQYTINSINNELFKAEAICTNCASCASC